jgi:hypothetical protein
MSMNQYKYVYLCRVLTAEDKFVQNQVLFFANIPARKDIEEQTFGTIKDAPKDGRVIIDGPYRIGWPDNVPEQQYVIHAIGQVGPAKFWTGDDWAEDIMIQECVAFPVRFKEEIDAMEVRNKLVEAYPKLIIGVGLDIGLPPREIAEIDGAAINWAELGPVAVSVLVDIAGAPPTARAEQLQDMAESFIATRGFIK